MRTRFLLTMLVLQNSLVKSRLRITLKAARLLSSCRICIYAGSLVNPEVLRLIPEHAEEIDHFSVNVIVCFHGRWLPV